MVYAEPLDMSGMVDCVGALTVQTTPQYAMKHGACKISDCVSEPGVPRGRGAVAITTL